MRDGHDFHFQNEIVILISNDDDIDFKTTVLTDFDMFEIINIEG